MKKRIAIFVGLIFAFLAGVFGPRYYEGYVAKKQTSSERLQLEQAIATNVEVEDIKNSPEAVALSWDECKEFTELFNTDEYNGFYVATFSSPDEIFWNTVLADGAGIKRKNLTKAEKEFYLDKNDADCLYSELVGISSSDLDSYIYSHTGIRLKSVKKDLCWIYNKDYDAYYKEQQFTSYEPCTCVSGLRVNNTYVLEMASDDFRADAYVDFPNKEIALVKTENGYVLKSNQNMWEVGNDPKYTMDLDIPQLGEDARLISYQGDEDYTEDGTSALIAIVIDNEMSDYVRLHCFTDEEDFDIKSIRDIGCFDVNADGVKDIIVVGKDFNSENKVVIITCEENYANDGYKLHPSESLSMRISTELGDNITTDAIREALLGESGGEYNTWQEAYKQFVMVKGSDFDEKYALAYIDDDDVPELVVDYYYCSTLDVYSFKDGMVKAVIKEYDYNVSESDEEETDIEGDTYKDLRGKYTADKFINMLNKNY
ncbi:hypothetical protein SAMN02910298_01520 [Pseudobutyrivibrio sp. YE44]|uniref:hypothetical protein n=1 Tax=Pseudobutyrivibrio sp. YE44 TaxID=1520802 RepID=UPI00088642F5|nr:hypothetical protein [Pseudobutyrivibrio sp. YE44]SDB30783.1 hypothetical protein SAMN02910298_01520 [Pseudobutyrivibrio sp. YE44]